MRNHCSDQKIKTKWAIETILVAESQFKWDIKDYVDNNATIDHVAQAGFFRKLWLKSWHENFNAIVKNKSTLIFH